MTRRALLALSLLTLLGPAGAQDDLTGAATTVTVVEAGTLRPLEGAEVRLRLDDEAPWSAPQRADARGCLTVNLADGLWDVQATCGGFLDGVAQTRVGEDEDGEIFVELSRPASVTVRVRQSDGGPAAGVVLALFAGPERSLPVGVTDAQGACASAGLAPGRYRLAGRLETASEVRSFPVLADVTLASGGKATVEARLGATPGRLRVRVASGGEPVAGAAVLVYVAASFPDEFVWSNADADGRVEVAVRPGPHHVWTPGLAAGVEDVAQQVVADRPTELALEVRTGALGGCVVDAAGWPAEGAFVLPLGPGGRSPVPQQHRVVDAFGRFDSRVVPPGRFRLAASAHARGAVAGDELVVADPPRAQSARLRLEPAATLRVLVVREDGSPATPRLPAYEAAHVVYRHVTLSHTHDRLTSASALPVSPRGRVVAPGVVPGDYAVAAAELPGGIGLVTAVQAIPGQDTPVRVQLRRPGGLVVEAPAGSSLSFTMPVGTDVELPLLQMPQTHVGIARWVDAPVVVDAQGLVTLDGVCPATYVVRGTAADGRALGPVSAVVAPGETSRVTLR